LAALFRDRRPHGLLLLQTPAAADAAAEDDRSPLGALLPQATEAGQFEGALGCLGPFLA